MRTIFVAALAASANALKMKVTDDTGDALAMAAQLARAPAEKPDPKPWKEIPYTKEEKINDAVGNNENKLHFFIIDNKELYNNDWETYRSTHGSDGELHNCSLAESDNWGGAQTCKFEWECRGARTCERGGWCSGFDGCYKTPLPL